FSNLKNLPLDYLKIDGSFIRNLSRDTVNQAMVTAMIKLARTLNFKVIAEQVEDSAAVEAAKRMGGDYLQGYAIGKPQPLTHAIAASGFGPSRARTSGRPRSCSSAGPWAWGRREIRGRGVRRTWRSALRCAA